MATDIHPYKISVPDADIDLLNRKLALTTFPDDIYEDSGDSPEDEFYGPGVPLSYMKHLVNHWQTRYSWRDAEAKLNQDLHQYTTTLDISDHGPLHVHFVHHKSYSDKAIPLLFSHGWPGSIFEVTRLINHLTATTDANGKDWPGFHVVAPSLPGYGFSEPPHKPGFGISKMAETCHKLMLKLGYDKYVTQGGDWGYFITRAMCMKYSSHIMAAHINLGLPKIPKASPTLFIPFMARYLSGLLSEHDKRGMERGRYYQQEGSGYYLEQSTKPQTIGYAQHDSPSGLLAWILEKIYIWTDPREWPQPPASMGPKTYAPSPEQDPDVEKIWTPDTILTWVSIYALGRGGPTSAMRLYYEVEHEKPFTAKEVSSGSGMHIVNAVKEFEPHVKFGLTSFPYELAGFPEGWYATMGNMVFYNERKSGGHFAAFESPKELAEDVRETFRRAGVIQ